MAKHMRREEGRPAGMDHTQFRLSSDSLLLPYAHLILDQLRHKERAWVSGPGTTMSTSTS